MKKLFYFLFTVALLVSCADKPKTLEVTVQNPSDFDRVADMVELPISDVKAKVALSDGQMYVVKNSKNGIITSQVTSDEKLIFQAGIKAGESATFTIEAGSQQNYKPQTYSRFITERKDDFAWENDRVAFRAYGPALVETDGPSNGIDIWYKKTPELTIDKWYKDDLAGTASYHDDHGEGLDDYKVGQTLGAGSMAPFADNKLWLNENFVSQEILDNGPLRSTFKLTHKDITVNDKTFSDSRTISIDAGSQLTKITQEYGTSESLSVAAGLVKRESGDSIIVAPDNTYLVYLEPATNKSKDVYVALVFPQGFDSTTIDTYKITNPVNQKESEFSHVLAVIEYKPNTPVTYYTGYGWGEFGFANEGEFVTYLNNFVKATKEPLKVTINQ